MDRDELLLTGLLLVVILIGLGVKQLAGGPEIEPVVIEAPRRPQPSPGAAAGMPSRAASALSRVPFHTAGSVPPAPEQLRDINQATPIELESVSGIGPSLSREILDYRHAHGPFRTMDELLQVSGIGPSRLRGLKGAFSVPGGALPPQESPAPAPAPEPQGRSSVERIDLNLASPGELESLSGIGPVYAQRIIDYRRRNGPFTHTEQIMDVPGIGPKRYEAIAGWLSVDSAAGSLVAEGSGESSPGGRPFRSTTSGGPARVGPDTQEKIDLNLASREQLEALPGIGPVLAGRILEYRQRHGAFQSPEEVKNISGIGEKKYAAIRPLIEISW